MPPVEAVEPVADEPAKVGADPLIELLRAAAADPQTHPHLREWCEALLAGDGVGAGARTAR
jgi:hypothetical protein